MTDSSSFLPDLEDFQHSLNGVVLCGRHLDFARLEFLTVLAPIGDHRGAQLTPIAVLSFELSSHLTCNLLYPSLQMPRLRVTKVPEPQNAATAGAKRREKV